MLSKHLLIKFFINVSLNQIWEHSGFCFVGLVFYLLFGSFMRLFKFLILNIMSIIWMCFSVFHQKPQHYIFNRHSYSTQATYFFSKCRRTVYSIPSLIPSSFSGTVLLQIRKTTLLTEFLMSSSLFFLFCSVSQRQFICL